MSKPNVNVKPSVNSIPNVAPKSNNAALAAIKELMLRRETLLETAEILLKTVEFLQKEKM